MSDHFPTKWIERLLEMLIAPQTHEHFRFFQAMARAEGGSAKNNPLNTTYPMPWSTLYNENPGVRNYGTPIEGIAATASTFARDKITNQYFLPLWIDLQSGAWLAEELLERNSNGIAKWGTDPNLMKRVLKEIP